MTKFALKLYITGQTAKSKRAVANLQQICDEELNGQYTMVVIDILEQPQLAENEKILATPTLIREVPQPLRRIIGDLANTEKVLMGLDIESNNEK